MPLSLDKYQKLSEKKSGGPRKTWTARTGWKTTLNLSQRCPILPNYTTDKFGYCYRVCQYRHQAVDRKKVSVECPARNTV